MKESYMPKHVLNERIAGNRSLEQQKLILGIIFESMQDCRHNNAQLHSTLLCH